MSFLNQEQDTAARAEVLHIFELCRELEGLRQEDEADTGPVNAKAVERFNKRNSQAMSALNALNAALNKFQFAPWLCGLGTYRVLWRAVKADAEPSAISTASIVKALLEMTEVGALERIRQCFCGRWFFAQTNKKTVCSDGCRFRKFKDGAQNFNQGRAQYMRNYRKNAKVIARKKKINGKTKTR